MWCWRGPLPTSGKPSLQILCLQQRTAAGPTYWFDTKRSARAGSLPAFHRTSNKCRESGLPSSETTCPACETEGISAKAVSLSFSLCPHLGSVVPTLRRQSAPASPWQLIRHSPALADRPRYGSQRPRGGWSPHRIQGRHIQD